MEMDTRHGVRQAVPSGPCAGPTPLITEAEVVASIAEAAARRESMGAPAFLSGIVADPDPADIGTRLDAGFILVQAGTTIEARDLGLGLLARAFVAASHLCVVTEVIERVFRPHVHDAYEFDRAEAAFEDHLRRLDAGEQVLKRFATLLRGSTGGKIFVIGFNKTGTTSLAQALQELDILCAPQGTFERLFRDWAARRFDRIVARCRHFEAFQDVPFSLPFTYQALDQAFPDARFILTRRGSADEWFESLCRFHRKGLFGGGEPTWEAIETSEYNYPENVAEQSRMLWRWQDFGLYDKSRAIGLYEDHNRAVEEYFATRPERLLTIDVADAGAYRAFCRFVGREPRRDRFEKVNASR
ncbi:MAG: sulfotransferase [Inquilinaceae bacterium]